MSDLPPSARRPKVQPYYLDAGDLRKAYHQQIRAYRDVPQHRYFVDLAWARLALLRAAKRRSRGNA